MNVLAYDLSSWTGFMLSAIFPDARRLPAIPGERARDVSARLSREAGRGSIFVFHVNLTDSSQCPVGRQSLRDALRARGWGVVNGAVLDISKRTIQQACSRLGLAVSAA